MGAPVAAQAVLGLSVDGCITQANAEAERIFGYTWDELVGQPLRLLVPDPAALPIEAERIALAKLRDGVQVRTGCLRKDGTSFPAGVSLSRMDTDRGVLISAAIQDLSLDDRLTYVQNLLDAVSGLCSDAVVVTGRDGTVRRWNAAAERLYGYSAEEILGRTWTPDGSDGDGDGGRTARPRRDGARVPVLAHRAPVADGSGRAVDIVDVSRAVEPAGPPPADGDLLAGMPMDSLGRLAAGVGHTFNNLLAIIAAHASMLEEELSAQPAGEQATTWLTDVAHIQRAVARAAAQTRQLLTFGRRAAAQPVPLDLRQVMAGTAPLLRESLHDSVRLAVGGADDLWPVLADPRQVEQVLVNLVANANDAMPHGGRIAIQADNAPVAGGGRFVRLVVRDSGAGMPPDVVARAFEPFFSTKPAGESGGMGLAIVHAVVCDAGGRAAIESTPGQGTAVTVLLPASDEPAAARSPAPVVADATAPRGAGTILVIEDEDDLRGAVRRMLGNSGYQILVANDGMEAIRIAATHPGPVDLLLSDVVMPEMSGPEVAEQIKTIRPGVRVLFMSGYDQPFLASRGRLGPRTEVMQKPFSREALLGRLRQVLSG
jgi:PAS domain S-box-containing protein